MALSLSEAGPGYPKLDPDASAARCPSQTSTIPWVCYRRRNQWPRLALASFCLPLIWLARVVYLLVGVAEGCGGWRGHAYPCASGSSRVFALCLFALGEADPIVYSCTSLQFVILICTSLRTTFVARRILFVLFHSLVKL